MIRRNWIGVNKPLPSILERFRAHFTRVCTEYMENLSRERGLQPCGEAIGGGGHDMDEQHQNLRLWKRIEIVNKSLEKMRRG